MNPPKLLLFLSFLFFGLLTIAQNRVPNGGFEKITKCPEAYGDFNVANWLPLGEKNTPDLFSGCAPATSFFNPKSEWMVKAVDGGQTYAGIVLFPGDEDGLAYHEIIYVKLDSALTKGIVYRLSFSLAVPLSSRWSCTTINAIFTKQLPEVTSDVASLKNSTNLLFDLEPMYSKPGWYTFENDFEAKGGETYLAIGNFRKTQETKAELLPGRNKDERYKTIFNMAYVCVDGVSVINVDANTPPIKKRDFTAQKTVVAAPTTAPKTAVPKPTPPATTPVKTEPAKQEVVQAKKTEAAKPAPVKPVVVEPVVPAGPPKRGDEELILSDLNFTTNSWQLKNKEVPELAPLIGFLKANPTKNVIVTGYTDNRGGKQANDLLSQRRADTITAYLVARGIDRSRISSRGFGSDMPVSTNDTDAGRSANRRVELRVQ